MLWYDIYVSLKRFVDESPRWLLIKGKFKEAKKVLTFIAKVNGKTFPEDLNLSRVNVVKVLFRMINLKYLILNLNNTSL